MKRYDPLLTLRALACLMVFVGHAFAVIFTPETLPSSINYGAWLLTPSPWVGVWVFFVLSGYLMGKGYFRERYTFTKEGVKAYFINRLLKIAPLYLVTVFICSALITPEIFQTKNLWMLWNILLFNYDGSLPINPNGSLWTVSTEVHFYLIVPILFSVFSSVDRKRALIFISIALVAALAYRGITVMTWGREVWYTLIYTPTFANMDLFLTGFLLNPLIRSYKTTIKNGIAIGFGLFFLFYALQAYIFGQAFVLHHQEAMILLKGFGPTVTAISIAGVIAMFELGDRHGEYRLGRKTEILGLMTYAIYVWHAPILTAIRNVAGPSSDLWSTAALSIIGIVVVLVVSTLSYYIIEVPFERRKITKKLGGPELTVGVSIASR
ncbi:MAG: acyltransferase [Methylovulum sp.]|nr:acyltransferase [Methylovulum sp.]